MRHLQIYDGSARVSMKVPVKAKRLQIKLTFFFQTDCAQLSINSK